MTGPTIRESCEEIERRTLAPYAGLASDSRGRRYPEAQDEYRTVYQRDRDRILYSSAFRRLQYKTQVYVAHEGDAYRTRLTHTLEVMQHARTLARVLRANEDLTEAIALGHDLGHAPFGHGGEEELNSLLLGKGGFEHNRQSLRLVDVLERRYSDFPGLNLSWETREGLARHVTVYDHPDEGGEFAGTPFPGLECQIVNLADRLAYCAHDLDDALRSGLLSLGDLGKGEPHVITRILAGLDEGLGPGLRRRLLIRSLIDHFTRAAIAETSRRLDAGRIDSPDKVRRHAGLLVGLASRDADDLDALGAFLHHEVYDHPSVRIMASKGRNVLRVLFERFKADPSLLPRRTQSILAEDRDPPERTIADYLAGMTDRYAMLVHQKLTDPDTPVGLGFGD